MSTKGRLFRLIPAVAVFAACGGGGPVIPPPPPPGAPDVSGSWNYQVLLTGAGWNCTGGPSPIAQINQSGSSFDGTYSQLELFCVGPNVTTQTLTVPAGQLVNGTLSPGQPTWNMSVEFTGLWTHVGSVAVLSGRAFDMFGHVDIDLAIPNVGTVSMDGTADFLR